MPQLSTRYVPIIYVISPKLTNHFTHRPAVPRLAPVSTDFPLIDASTLGYEHSKWWWARPDLNWRSSPCQGDVITPRPRALVSSLNRTVYGWFVYGRSNHPTIFEIFPLHPACEHVPPTRLRPLPMVKCLTSWIGPYVLHFRQNPSYSAMLSYRWDDGGIWTIRKKCQIMIKR